MISKPWLVTLGASAIAAGISLFFAGGLLGGDVILFYRVLKPVEFYLVATVLISCGVGSVVMATRSIWGARLEAE